MAGYLFDTFQIYLRQLCVKHKDILHDDASQKSFIRFQSDEDLQSLPSNAGSVMVIVSNFTGRAVGATEEHKLLQVVEIVFLVNANNVDGDMAGAIEASQRKAMGIMFDFYAKMKKDQQDDDCGPLKDLQTEAMTFFPADGPMFENMYGWEMSIPFNATAPGYNPEKWNP